MKIKCSERGSCIFCTFTSVQEDYNKFPQSGYSIKNFKCYDNVTEEMFINWSGSCDSFSFILKYY